MGTLTRRRATRASGSKTLCSRPLEPDRFLGACRTSTYDGDMTLRITERRSRRSEKPGIALQYQLEYTRDQARLEAVVLADDQGLPVAVAGDPAVCSELAAMAPWMTLQPRMPMPPLLRGADVTVRSFRLHGESLHLAAVGGSVARDALLACSLRGVERILARN